MKNFRIIFTDNSIAFSMQVLDIIEAIQSAMERNNGKVVKEAFELE